MDNILKHVENALQKMKGRPDTLRVAEFSVFFLFSTISLNIVANKGVSGLVRYYVEQARLLPFVNSIISVVLEGEVKGAVKMLTGVDRSEQKNEKLIEIPKFGISAEALMEILHKLHETETAAEEGKAFAYTYTTTKDMNVLANLMSTAYRQYSENSGSGVDEMNKLLNDTWEKYMHTNCLNPMVSWLLYLLLNNSILCHLCYRYILLCERWRLRLFL